MTDLEQPPHDSIREALRELPRVAASAGFNRELMARWRTREAQQSARWPRLVVAALLLAVAGSGLFLAYQRGERLNYQRQRAALGQRHDDLRRELAEVRERAASPPRLYLGTASNVDLVLDLEPWMHDPQSIQPASYSTSRP